MIVISEFSVGETSSFCKSCIARAWIEVTKNKNAASRIGALRTIVMSKTRIALLLMKNGTIPMVPQQIDTTLRIEGTPFDCDPDLKKALIIEAERQREEKNNSNPT